MDSIEEFEVGDLTVRIHLDEDAESPRTAYDEASHMVCWHPRYKLGDEHNYQTPEDFEEAREELDIAVIKPLYLYDHSGITISTGAFSDQWDSGQVGWVYMTKNEVAKEWGGDVERADKRIEREVETYDLYLTGQVYGYEVVRITEDGDEEDIGSCWGFYGMDDCKDEAQRAAEYELRRYAEAEQQATIYMAL